MTLYGNLNSLAQSFARQVEEGKMRISAIQDYGNKIVVVFVPAETVDKSVQVLDFTQEKDIEVPQEETTESNNVDLVQTESKYDEENRLIVEVDASGKPTMVKCRYCGEVFAARGITRHENKCPKRTS